jgi:hypothetical protein
MGKTRTYVNPNGYRIACLFPEIVPYCSMIDPEHVMRCNRLGLDQWHRNQLERDEMKRSNVERRELIDHLGGECIACGFKPTSPAMYAALEFHHRDPTAKRFSLSASNIYSRPWEVVLGEAAKCDLLCANCHRIMHYGTGTRPRRKKTFQQVLRQSNKKANKAAPAEASTTVLPAPEAA